MKTFKELAYEDIGRTFFNMAEFGEEHDIDGQKMPAVIDAYSLHSRSRGAFEGWNSDGTELASEGILTAYIPRQSLGKQPREGARMDLDGRPFRVRSAVSEGGVYVLTLGRYLA